MVMRHAIVLSLMLISSPALALSFSDIAIISPAGSDANNCVWHAPFAPPQPPACATGTHAATLLKGPSSKLAFLTGTYHEIVSVHVPKEKWPTIHNGLNIGLLNSSQSAIFDGGGFVITGDGWVSIKGLKMKNCPGDCISIQGISTSDTMHGNIEDENIYSSSGHIITLVNTTGFELGYNFFKNSDKSHLFVSNSPGYNIHETSTLMDVKKKPQLGAYIINSAGGLFDTHVDAYTGPTALSAVNSPHLSDPIVLTPRKGNVCPASDVATDTFSSSWTAITSNGCIVQ